MKRFMLAALAAATFSTAACGGDPCKKVVEKVCAEVKNCDAWKKTFEEGSKAAGDKAGDMCKAVLDNKASMDGLIKAAKAVEGATGGGDKK